MKNSISMIYRLFLFLTHSVTLKIGALGLHELPSGWYVYVGRAPERLLRHRLRRHFSRKKRLRRHIDYLTVHFRPTFAYVPLRLQEEHEAVKRLIEQGLEEAIKGFGSSDDPQARTHLLYSKALKSPLERLESLFLPGLIFHEGNL